MTQPITKSQLDALEAAADKVFGKLGIDIEFTRHFLDRVNDERNRKQITIRELGELFAKEYRRWGRKISAMPVNSQAVMKDLSSELNIPFVLNKDGKEKDLVAKTVMRKKDFRTPNPELPVESVNEAGRHRDHVPRKGSNSEVTIKGIEIPLKKESWGDWTVPYGKFKNIGNFKSKRELIAALKQKADQVQEEKHGAKKGTQVRGRDSTPKMTKPSHKGQQPHPMRGKLVGEGDKQTWDVVANRTGKILATFDVEALAPRHYWVEKGWATVKPNHGGRKGEIYNESMDERPLDVKTPTAEEIAQMHGVDLEMIEQQLQMGLKVEMEHTDDPFAAMEIALDHLKEMPDYYTHLAGMESEYTQEMVRASWQAYQVNEKLSDPREAILNMALKFLDRKVKSKRDQSSLAGYAYDVAKEINLNQIGVNAKELAQLYRDWQGDNVVAEGWMEENLYYLDEVTETKKKTKSIKKKK